MYTVCTETALPSLTTAIFPLRSAKITVVGHINTLLLGTFLGVDRVGHSLTLTLPHSPTGVMKEWSELELFEGGMVCCVSVLVV
jgi:hypothetical protein